MNDPTVPQPQPSQVVEIATSLHLSGFNCSQAVFASLAETLGFERAHALRIASPFGGGMGRSGGTCGAVTGALMALGIQYGFSEPDPKVKDQVYVLTREFMQRFQAKHGALACKDLIGLDLSTPDGSQKARELGVFKEKCSYFIIDAVEIAYDMLVKEKE